MSESKHNLEFNEEITADGYWRAICACGDVFIVLGEVAALNKHAEHQSDKKPLRRYAQCAGDPEGFTERLTDCIAGVHRGREGRFTQCEHKRGHGPNGEYCKQHAKKVEARNGT